MSAEARDAGLHARPELPAPDVSCLRQQKGDCGL
jgi:hypothetical protein